MSSCNQWTLFDYYCVGRLTPVGCQEVLDQTFMFYYFYVKVMGHDAVLHHLWIMDNRNFRIMEPHLHVKYQ